MKIVEEILKWAKDLPNWQSDAARLIWVNSELSATDEDEIYDYLREEVGLGTLADKSHPKAIPLSSSDIGSGTVHGHKVTVLSMRNMENVNAIPSTEKLEFSDQGITAIYGDNSAGKSGYSRVLKKSCHARGTADPIYPNIYKHEAGAHFARAKFDVQIGEAKPTTVEWNDGQAVPECLANIAVFDSQTARVYVDEANEVSYIPYGLDVFTKIAALCRSLRARIQSELQGIPAVPETISKLVGPTCRIKSIQQNTTWEDIVKLAPFSKDDAVREDELSKSVASYKANDPIKRSRELRIQKGRIDGLRESLLNISKELSTSAVAEAKRTTNAAASASRAAQLASQKAFSNEPLPGTGGEEWRIMFESASKFSEKAAYPNKPFPVTDSDTLCLLCQQPLGEPAKDRLRRFWEFVEADTAKIAKTKSDTLRSLRQRYDRLDVNPFSRNPQLLDEIMTLSSEAANEIENWVKEQEKRRIRLLRSMDTNDWANIGEFSVAPSPYLFKLSKQCEAEARETEALANPESMKKTEAELSDLNYRKAVSGSKTTILEWIQILKRGAKLRAALKMVDTTQITKRGSTLMEKALTQELQDSLAKEFDALGIEHLNLNFERTGSIGSTYHKLHLCDRNSGKANLSEILSEGEQRVVAIASFMAELSTSSHDCGIVFDDPVSSLDHFWRTRVARRLVKEGLRRQVIVFTHDIVFLLELQREAEEQKVKLMMQRVFRTEHDAGLCSPDLPWLATSTSARIRYLRGYLEAIERDYKGTKMESYCLGVERFYGLLRETWERAIEEVLLNDSVMRFRQGIQTQRLLKVTIEPEDKADIDTGMTRCSKYMKGHDESPATGMELALPKELHKDLELIENFRNRIEGRRQHKSSVKSS